MTHAARSSRSCFPALFLVLGFLVAACGLASANPNGASGTSPQAIQKTSAPDDPQIKKIIDQMSAAGVLHPTTLDQAKQAYRFYTKFSGPPEQVFRVVNRTIPGPAGNIAIRIYYPSAEPNLPVWVFFHGGGFVTGDLDTHDVPLRAVTNRCNCLIVSVVYRLAPQNSFPAAPDDCYAATKWVVENGAEIGADPSRIAVGGDGAGGNLAAVVALMARDHGTPHLVFQVLIYPILDANMSTRSWIESSDPLLTNDAMLAKLGAYVPISPNLPKPFDDPYVSPVNAKDLHGLPPALIITDSSDPLRDEDVQYAADLQGAGIPAEPSQYSNVIHGFFLMSGELEAGKKSIDQISAALQHAFAEKQRR